MSNMFNMASLFKSARKQGSVNKNRRGSSSRLRLSYKDVYTLEILPKKITEMEAEIDKLKIDFK